MCVFVVLRAVCLHSCFVTIFCVCVSMLGASLCVCVSDVCGAATPPSRHPTTNHAPPSFHLQPPQHPYTQQHTQHRTNTHKTQPPTHKTQRKHRRLKSLSQIPLHDVNLKLLQKIRREAFHVGLSFDKVCDEFDMHCVNGGLSKHRFIHVVEDLIKPRYLLCVTVCHCVCVCVCVCIVCVCVRVCIVRVHLCVRM